MSEASRYGGWLMFTYAFMQFLFAPVLGNLSDQYGRRPVILFSLLGFGLDYLLLAWSPSITWLFVARILSGITGASFTTASAYIADISTPEKRAQNFGMDSLFCLSRLMLPNAENLNGKEPIQLVRSFT
jgi:DHA1 family tetracycline resistance protein-like MFS transporter